MGRAVLLAMTEMAVEMPATKPAARNAVTWVGLFIALFAMIIVREAFRMITPEPGTALTLAKEMCMFLCAAGLLWLVRQGERLPLSSVGINTSPLWKSLLWGLVTAFVCTVTAALLVSALHYGNGPGSQAFAKLPLWVVSIVVLRAGVVEELFYRGYAIERLQAIGLGRIASWSIPLVIFAIAHWTGGAANIVIALVLGAILTAFYAWRRDLVANMIGHFLVDFAANVLLPLVGAGH